MVKTHEVILKSLEQHKNIDGSLFVCGMQAKFEGDYII